MTRTAAATRAAMAAVLIQLALAGLLPAGARAASPDAAATAQAATAPYTSPTIEGCVLAAARVHRLPPAMLVILLNVEGGSLGRVSQNTNDTVDIGPMQVNQIWIPLVAAHWHASARYAIISAPTSKPAPGFCAMVSMKPAAISGKASASITPTIPTRKSDISARFSARRSACRRWPCAPPLPSIPRMRPQASCWVRPVSSRPA